jgi:hypothetical protein
VRLITSRQIEEGIQTSHFSAGGSRFTGRFPVAGAPVIALVGDSYIVAREVADGATMGAWVERLSAQALQPINVRQYGWRGAGPAQYFAIAPQLLKRWSPERVVVVLSDDDLDAHAVTTTTPRMRIAPDGSVRVLGFPERSTAAHTSLTLLQRSRLVTLARRRIALLQLRAQRPYDHWRRRFGLADPPSPAGTVVLASSGYSPTTTIEGPPDSAEIGAVPATVVRELARLFGDRLAIAYIANIGMRGGESADPPEAELLGECRRQQVQCVSSRKGMLALRRRGIVVRGFSTTTLGDGHLNSAGHQLLGRIIWSMLASPRITSRRR